MLHIHHSNRLETLAANLLDSDTNQNSHPFTPRTIITESPSLARWLRHQFCLNQGIACLIDTPLAAAWLWHQARRLLGLNQGEDPLSRERMQWQIHAALMPDAPLWSEAAMTELARYLQSDDTGLKRWQLSGHIADSFDRYQYYRPELIEKWSTGQDDPQWQAVLWREISRNTDIHRVALMKQFLDKLNATPESDSRLNQFPDRLDLFSIHNLPPLLLTAFAAIARHIPVHLWLLAPTPEYWADLSTPRQMAHKRLEDPDNAGYWQAGNPLLTQWGRQAQAFQDLLLELETIDSDEGQFHEPARDSLLGNLQADIYAASNETKPGTEAITENGFSSIQLHICHSPMRECQVLHDTLLHCLNENPCLQPEDMLVLVPDISRYAPYIEAVFGRNPSENEQRLAFNLSDIVLADEHPLIRAFLKLLQLPESRFTRAELLSLVNLPEVRRHFGLSQDDNAWLAELFDQLRIYWGLDGEDKNTRFDLPGIEDNTWHQGFRRIMAGFALGTEQRYRLNNADLVPQPGLTAQGAERAARFFNLLHSLRHWSTELAKTSSAIEWSKRLARLLDTIFGEDPDEDDRLTQIREILAELAETGEENSTLLSPAVIHYWLTRTLSTRANRARFYSGGITFCGLQPLRGVPFKVICLLGMQEQAFPRRHSGVEFDIMAEHWRHGDPDPALEDRYLFLETLLATRERLIISYTGRNDRTNEPLQASVVVQELLDYLDQRYRIDDRPPSEALQQVHPLQAFGRNNFSNTNRPGFDHWWLAIARSLLEHRPPKVKEGWPTIHPGLPEELQRQISPQALGKFFKHPVRHFVQQQLHIFEARDIELIEDEPFSLDHLQQWQIRELLLSYWLQGDMDEARHLIKAQGMLPHGQAGEQTLSELETGFSDMLDPLNAILSIQPPLQRRPVDIDLRLALDGQAWQMSGRLHHAYEKIGLLQLSASKYELSNLLPLWIEHLCLHALKHPLAGTSLFISRDANFQLQAIDSGLARKLLTDLVTIYQQGLSSPLPFMRKSASAWITSWNKNQDPRKALDDARKKWNSSYNHTGENEDFYIQLILRGHDWTPDEDFARYSRAILEPLQAHLEPLT